MRRIVLVLIAACVLAALLLPAAASANGWMVRNGAGEKIGKVVRKTTRKCVVYDRRGRKCGTVEWNRIEKRYTAAHWYESDYGVRNLARLSGPHMTDSYDWYIENENEDNASGLALKKAGRWVVLTWSSNRVRARVSGRCPGWGAAGAGFILSKAFH